MDDARLRESLVSEMRRNGSLTSESVAAAFLAVPRHRFIPDVAVSEAYADRAISIKTEGSETLASISQPSMIARMLELANVRIGDRVLEVGTGSGYNAALLATLVGSEGSVVTVEVESDLAARARETLADCGFGNAAVVHGDGHAGDASHAPYDRIIVSARTSDITPAWWAQLRDGGRIVVPLEIGIGGEYAVGFERTDGRLKGIGIVHCLFVPLRGEQSEIPVGNVFARSADARYATGPRSIKEIVALKTAEASPELLRHADIVVAQPQTTFAITWG